MRGNEKDSFADILQKYLDNDASFFQGQQKNVLYLRAFSYRNWKLLNAGKSYFDRFRYLEKGSCYTITGLSISWVTFGKVLNQVHSSYVIVHSMKCKSSNITNVSVIQRQITVFKRGCENIAMSEDIIWINVVYVLSSYLVFKTINNTHRYWRHIQNKRAFEKT